MKTVTTNEDIQKVINNEILNVIKDSDYNWGLSTADDCECFSTKEELEDYIADVLDDDTHDYQRWISVNIGGLEYIVYEDSGIEGDGNIDTLTKYIESNYPDENDPERIAYALISRISEMI